jgi:hypothetical protein
MDHAAQQAVGYMYRAYHEGQPKSESKNTVSGLAPAGRRAKQAG